MSTCFVSLAPFSLDTIREKLKEIQTSEKTNVFLIGYGCDFGAAQCDSRTGQEKGPESLQEAMASTQMPFF
jgi:hypothetical protein